MKYEQRDNSGSTFKNDNKQKQSHPDYKGSAKINGVEYWVSTWIKISQNGTEFLSHSFTPKQQSPHHEAKANGYAPRQLSTEQPTTVKANPEPKQDSDFNDDIPF
jgi:hypothetical protein